MTTFRHPFFSMKKTSLQLYRYSIPLRTPFHSAAGTIKKREGLLMGDLPAIWTEIAPLPGFSTETVGECSEFLIEHAKKIAHHFRNTSIDELLSDLSITDQLNRLPSVRFGLSMLSEQQKAINAGHPLHVFWKEQLFPDRQDASSTGHTVRCNAVLPLSDTDALSETIHIRKESGFRTLKIKLPEQPREASSLIHQVCEGFPDLVFRFDANRAFSLSDARILFESLNQDRNDPIKGLPIQNLQYIEEPLQDPDPADMAELSKTGVPLAADESARTPADVRSFAESNSVAFLVIKPMLFGSFTELTSAIRGPLPVVISSVFETVVGRTLLAHLASVCNVKRELDHGLATGPFLEHDFVSTPSRPYIETGTFSHGDIRPDIHRSWITRVKAMGSS